MDFRNAFDFVDHLENHSRSLFPNYYVHGLNHYYIKGATVFVCQVFFVRSILFLNGGMLHGSVLSPISFIIHIDYLELYSTYLSMLMSLHCPKLLV